MHKQLLNRAVWFVPFYYSVRCQAGMRQNEKSWGLSLFFYSWLCLVLPPRACQAQTGTKTFIAYSLKDEEEIMREYAVKALGMIEDARAIQPLRDLLSTEKSHNIKETIIEANKKLEK